MVGDHTDVHIGFSFNEPPLLILSNPKLWAALFSSAGPHKERSPVLGESCRVQVEARPSFCIQCVVISSISLDFRVWKGTMQFSHLFLSDCPASLGMFFSHLGRYYTCKSIYYFDFGILSRALAVHLNYYPSSFYLLVNFAEMWSVGWVLCKAYCPIKTHLKSLVNPGD